MRSEPTPRNVIATIILLAALMFAKLAFLESALQNPTGYGAITPGRFIVYAAIANLVMLGWGSLVAWRYRKPSDLHVILVTLTVGDAVLLVVLLVARHAAG